MDNVFFSIVIPTYNRADLIAQTIDSLLVLDYRNYELIVVDDGSTDNTEEIIRSRYKVPRLTYYKKNNAERAAARNYGAQKAKGEYINFFDSDDLALANHLRTAAQLVGEKKEPEWFHLAYGWMYPNGKIYKNVNDFTGATLNGIMHKGNSLSCNGVFIRRDIILSNPFNEDRILSASEDYELWLRLTSKYPLYYSNTVTSLIVNHDERSVHTINGKKLVARLEAFIRYVNTNQDVVNYFSNGKMKRISAEGYSYMATQLALVSKHKGHSLQYLFKSLLAYPYFIFDKRIYATIKNLLIKWQTS
jgi:glycosyltransferase involved in cell wall biosynthesis